MAVAVGTMPIYLVLASSAAATHNAKLRDTVAVLSFIS